MMHATASCLAMVILGLMANGCTTQEEAIPTPIVIKQDVLLNKVILDNAVTLTCSREGGRIDGVFTQGPIAVTVPLYVHDIVYALPQHSIAIRSHPPEGNSLLIFSLHSTPKSPDNRIITLHHDGRYEAMAFNLRWVHYPFLLVLEAQHSREGEIRRGRIREIMVNMSDATQTPLYGAWIETSGTIE